MSNFGSFGKKAAVAALAALTLGAGLTANSNEAEARYGRKGAAIAAGIIGAVAAGAIVAGTRRSYAAPGYYGSPVYHGTTSPYYGHAGPAYYAPSHVYYDDVYAGPVCTVRRKKVWLDAYRYTYRSVRVCH